MDPINQDSPGDSLTVKTLDAVDIHLDLAGLGSRSYAFIIDWHIRLAAALAWFLLGGLIADGVGMAGFDGEDYFASRIILVMLPAAAIYFLYHPILEVFMKGLTPGKRLAGIRIVSSDGGPPSVAALLIRNLFRLIDSLPTFYGIGITCMIFNKRQLRVGDMAAGTLLIFRDKQVTTTPGVVTAQGSLSLQQTDLAEELLSRWFDLEPESRYSLARQLMAGSSDAELRDQAERLQDDALRSALQQTLVQANDPAI